MSGVDVEAGLDYWNQQPASNDGVLGGFGTGTLPRVESLGSRLFLLHLLPELSTVPSAFRPLNPPPSRRTRALDVGAGIGRVTGDVLLHLFSDVVLLEPAEHFIRAAIDRGRASQSPTPNEPHPWKGIAEGSKSVTFLQGTLQDFDPARPHHANMLERVGYAPEKTDAVSGFDVIWCQWCLGHLDTDDLVAFFRRSHAALREKDRSLIVVKENLCSDAPDGSAVTILDDQDSSLTRSDRAWKDAFEAADLTLVEERVQDGLPEGLYQVKMYALR
ncbi:Alpha N-terminal protein methyltransferase 1 [Mycena indigotica]|uniref:Alpha N-terminal protein methyltransferase 1 n=1 Tax=Mycena indigotica TaxID=2126181 RepID=A0A8H6VWX2_9AGAR|nr:Alpha N-terminal protein methyltransferase 1 [Mycena indigotica]KAF7294886.1 Alpha N-terminal protein methyltransferase 1 [Mycena indigotica]